MKLKVMTFNIIHCQDYPLHKQTGKDVINIKSTAEAIKSCDCDIVSLNEVRNAGPNCDYRNQTKILAKLAGYKYSYFGEAIRFGHLFPYGNAVLSKYPFKNVETIKIEDPLIKDEKVYYETRCIIKAVITIDKKDITFIASHFGLANSEKINAVDTVCRLIDESNQPVILAGDFNMQPDDIKLKPIFDRLKDTQIKFTSPKYSFPSDRPRILIDYILVSDDVIIEKADIPEILISDHRPRICEIIV